MFVKEGGDERKGKEHVSDIEIGPDVQLLSEYSPKQSRLELLKLDNVLEDGKTSSTEGMV